MKNDFFFFTYMTLFIGLNFNQHSIDTSKIALMVMFASVTYGNIKLKPKIYKAIKLIPKKKIGLHRYVNFKGHVDYSSSYTSSKKKIAVKKMAVFKHDNPVIQESIRIILNWLKTLNLPTITTCYIKQSDIEYSKSVLLELLRKYPRFLIDFLHGFNQPSQELAGALSHLIMISIHIPIKFTQTHTALVNLLCVCNDSFIFDFILECLDEKEMLCLTYSSFNKRITRYIPFLQSDSPEYKENKTYFSRLLVSFKRLNQVNSTEFGCLLESVMHQIEIIEADFVQSPCLLSRSEHTLENRAVGNPSVLGYHPSVDYEDVYGLDKNVVIIPANASYNYVCKYRSHYFSQKARIEKLMDSLDICLKIQESLKNGVSSSSISLGIAQIKNACSAVFKKIEKAEKLLMNFERGFILFRMCRIIPNCYIKDGFSEILFEATQRHIQGQDFTNLKNLINLKGQLISCLETTFKKSIEFSDKKLVKVYSRQIAIIFKERRDYLSAYSQILKTWKQLIPIMDSINETHHVFSELLKAHANIHLNFDFIENILLFLSEEINTINWKRFTNFLQSHQLQIIDPFFTHWGIVAQDLDTDLPMAHPETKTQFMASKVIRSIIDNISKEIYVLKTKINNAKVAWREYKEYAYLK